MSDLLQDDVHWKIPVGTRSLQLKNSYFFLMGGMLHYISTRYHNRKDWPSVATVADKERVIVLFTVAISQESALWYFVEILVVT